MSSVDSFDVVIVGGGPAGAAAAVAARNFDLTVCLIDEQPRFGGQIYRQPPAGFRVDSWLAGSAYAKGKELLARVERLSGLKHVAPATVCGVFAAASPASSNVRHEILFHDAHRLGRIGARFVLLATGCYEMPVPFPGWQLPGVMGAGGIQTLLKSQRVAAGRSIMLAGSHPLLLVVAEQLLAAGVKVAGVAFTQSAARTWQLLRTPRAAVTGARQLVRSVQTFAQLRRARVPVYFGHAVIEVSGSGEVQAVRLRQLGRRATETTVSCDALGMCYGFLASSELARQAGARHSWTHESGWVVHADDYMRTSVAGLVVAGEQTGVAGAEAAALSGEIAAVGMALDADRLSIEAADEHTRGLRTRLRRVRRFAAVLAKLSAPDPGLLKTLAQRATLLCRCEDVTVGELTDAVCADPGIRSASTAKLITRVGMGYCQGRTCELGVRRIIAAERRCGIEEVAGYVARVPVKPVPVALLAAVPRALDIDPAALELSAVEAAPAP